MVSPFSKEELEQLLVLKQRLRALRGFVEVSYEYHLAEALNEYERGLYLASALIASRAILFALRQHFGEPLAETLQAAVTNKAEHGAARAAYEHARSIFSYDLTIVPSSTEALALLSDAYDLIDLLGHGSAEQSKSS
jgi:hypothetical protein